MVKPSIPLTLFRILNLIFTLTVTYFAIGVVALAWIPKLTFDSLPVWLILSSLLSGFTSYHYYKADLAQLDWSLPAGKWLKSAKTLIPYLLLAPSIYAVSISVRAQISHHGSFHSAIIYQISQGIIPPENATLAGAPTNYYWPYHALYASLVDLLQRPTPMISAAMNILVLAAVLGWIYQLLQAQYPKLSGWFTSLLSLLALLGGNLFGMYYQITIEGQFPPNEWFPYAFGDNRLNNILNKFLNFNGFPYGILLFVFSLYLYQRLLNDRFKFMDGLFLVTAGLGALGLHTTSGALVITLLPVALVLTLLLTKKFLNCLRAVGVG